MSRFRTLMSRTQTAHKTSNEGAFTMETGCVLQWQFVELKKELLQATKEQHGTRERFSWALVDVPA